MNISLFMYGLRIFLCYLIYFKFLRWLCCSSNTKTWKQQTDEAEAAAKPCSYSTSKIGTGALHVLVWQTLLFSPGRDREEMAGGISCHHATRYDQMWRDSAEML